MRHSTRRRQNLAAAFLVCMMGAFAGQALAQAAYEQVQAPGLSPADRIPAPQGSVVLKVYGAARAPAGEAIPFDLVALERPGTVRHASRNRWIDREVVFEGVLGRTLLDFVGVPEGAAHLRMRALYDDGVRVPIDDLLRRPVLLAIRLDGEYMPVKDKGPIWRVYPNHVDPAPGGTLHQDK